MRTLLAALLLLIAPATASAWSDPAPVRENASFALAADGTLLETWGDDAGVHVRVGETPPVLLATDSPVYPSAVAAGNDLAVAWDRDGFTRVATGSTSAGMSAPETFSGFFARLIGNRAGDMALMTTTPDAYSVAFRPAGGHFGGLVASPAPTGRSRRVLVIDPRPFMTLSPTGETLVAWTDPTVHVASRQGDGPFGEPVTLPGNPLSSLRGGPVVALDAHGRGLAFWEGGEAQLALRDADGAWRLPAGAPAHAGYPQAQAGDDGQAVIGFVTASGYGIAPVSLATGAVGTVVDYPLTVDSEGIPPPPDSTATSSGYPQLRVAADGSSRLVFNHYREVLVARNLGTPEVAACQLLRDSPQPLGDGAALLVSRYPDGVGSIVRDTPGPAHTCPAPETPFGKPHAVYSTRRVFAGERVRIDVPGLRHANATITGNGWDMGDPYIVNRADTLDYTFPKPGHVRWSIDSKQSFEGGGAIEFTFKTAVDVYARATLRVTRAGRVFASALTYGPARRLIVVTGGRRRTLTAGLRPRRVPLRAHGRVKLIQDGRVVASAR